MLHEIQRICSRYSAGLPGSPPQGDAAVLSKDALLAVLPTAALRGLSGPT